MLLKSLKLRNIRSYIDESITFPPGIVLLAGDIGAGKSTILLAIEFAFFGLLRGELSGASLLRNGAREGTVELSFELNGNDYTIGRALKRSKTSVEQEAGFVIESGLRRELTAVELKSWALQLLGYPADLLTKSKSMIYRYTVYTPQEEMKRIILEDQEARLAVLRKVFDIDKYKRIADNAGAYAKLLRERKRTYEGQLLDEPAKKQQLTDKQKQAGAIQQALMDIQQPINEAKRAVHQQNDALAKLEAERNSLIERRAACQAAETELTTLKQHQQRAQQELAQLAPMLANNASAPTLQPETLAKVLEQKQHALLITEKELRLHINAHAELKANKHLSEATTQRILSLDQCPSCFQPVSASHKHQFAQEEQKKTETLASQMASAQEAITAREQEKQRLANEILDCQQKHALARETQLKHQQYLLNQQRKQQLETTLAQAEESIKSAELRKQQAVTGIQQSSALETQYLAEKSRLDTLRQHEQTMLIKHATLIEQAKAVKEAITILTQDLAAKQQAREKLDKLSALHQWTSEFFTSLLSVMEKHVMAKVYHDFNTLFQTWFGMLIHDQVLQARLDEAFTPVLQQNGYDTLIDNLSGGEKTACALAYRLALHKVVTSLHSTIQTKDVLILDEPTDGFSADQLERMREVLENVRAKQVILVSHEAMIESAADHVLRVAKDEHISTVTV